MRRATEFSLVLAAFLPRHKFVALVSSRRTKEAGIKKLVAIVVKIQRCCFRLAVKITVPRAMPAHRAPAGPQGARGV
jgi:hypothetical protein